MNTKTEKHNTVPSDELLAACRRLVKRWRIQATDREGWTWKISPSPGPLIATWLRECATELEREINPAKKGTPKKSQNPC